MEDSIPLVLPKISGVKSLNGKSVKNEVAAGKLCQVILEGRDMWRPLGVIRRRAKAITPAMRELIELLKAGRDTTV